DRPRGAARADRVPARRSRRRSVAGLPALPARARCPDSPWCSCEHCEPKRRASLSRAAGKRCRGPTTARRVAAVRTIGTAEPGGAAVIQRTLMTRRIAVALLVLLAGCSSLLPKSKEVTASPWQSYQDAQEAFDKIIPGHTTIA